MSRLFYHVMQDNLGNLLFDVSGTMRLAGTGTAATIYGDAALTIPIPNPMTNHPSFGSFKCYLGAGNYDFYMAKAGYSFETLTGVQGWGTLALQDASNVAITGGSVGVTGTFASDGNTYLRGPVTVGPGAGQSSVRLFVWYKQASHAGILLQPDDADTGAFSAVILQNIGGVAVGSIKSTASATAYNTTSDRRLKTALAPLTGALSTIMRLIPRTFRWKHTGELGHGFVADEVAQVVDGVTMGRPDAVRADGAIDPMQMDNAKLMPHLVAAVQEVVRRLEVLEAQAAAR